MSRISYPLITIAIGVSACAHGDVTSPGGSLGTASVACAPSGTLQLGIAQAARIDCSQGGTTVSLAGNGASYLIVPQFAVDLVPNNLVAYRLNSGSAASANIGTLAASSIPFAAIQRSPGTPMPGAAQRAFDRTLRDRAFRRTTAGAWPSPARDAGVWANVASAAVPALGTTRAFRVLASTTGATFSSVTGQLAFAGNNVLLYIDTLAPSERLHVGAVAGVRTAVRPDTLSDRHRRVRTAQRSSIRMGA